MPKTKPKRLRLPKVKSEYDEFMEYPDFDKATLYFAARRAHTVLQDSIKHALGLEKWPNFDHHPRNALLSSCIGHLLIEEVGKLRKQLATAVAVLKKHEYCCTQDMANDDWCLHCNASKQTKKHAKGCEFAAVVNGTSVEDKS